jgi:ArsR family metal-binding transcriptional regulator
MLLTGSRNEFVRPECSHHSQDIACIAHLNDDIGEVIPYLNAALGGCQFVREPLCVTFKIEGRLISVYPKKICITALADEAQGEKVIEWLTREINDAWERRAAIQPRYEGASKPVLIEVLKLLPKTNCRECGLPTCMVFAAQVAAGGKGADDCPALSEEKKAKLREYLTHF